MPSGFTVVILAAGQGTRMRSALPKVLHPICGRPMVLWLVHAAREAGARRVIVVDNPEERLAEHLPPGVEVAVQQEQRGTGDALAAGLALLDGDAAGAAVVVNGDMPLLTAKTVTGLLATHEAAGAGATLATMELADPTGYGRVVRGTGGEVERVAETKVAGDATPEELAIREVSAGLYAFDLAAVRGALARVGADNAQGETYLPDVVPILRAAGRSVQASPVEDPHVALGVNDRVELATVTALAQQRIHRAHQLAGVTIVDPASTLIEAGVTIGADTVVEPATFLRGATRIGSGAAIGPATTIADCEVGDRASVVHSYLQGAIVGEGATVGPFAYLRPGAELREGAKGGTFVEIKNSTIGAGTKVPHLSYIGDTEIGEKSNIGAGTITANYDGYTKHRTRIGSGVRVSVHTSLVAPVSVGDGAYTGAGSVITEDVPAGALGIARARQTNLEGYAERVQERRRAAR